MNYRYRRSKLKLKPPDPEKQKAFINNLHDTLQKSRIKRIELDTYLNSRWIRFISDPNRKIKKDNSVKIFICFWVIYFIILWLV